MNIALIVEGDGDRLAVPELIRRIINHNEIFHVTVAPQPIKAGDVKKLTRAGQIERFVQYACERDADGVLIILDCDDDCAVEVAQDYTGRVRGIAARYRKRVGIALIQKEFESLFLYSCAELAETFPKYPWNLHEYNADEDFEAIRGAKERFSRYLGKPYKETLDQPRFAASLDIERLRLTSLSFQHLERVVMWFAEPCAGDTTYPA